MAFTGILSAMVTPFDADGGLAEEETARLARHVLANGSDGLVLTGTTGEASTLSDDEKARVWEIGLDVARTEKPGAPVIAGTGSNDTRHAIELNERAAAARVDGVLVVAPYYNRPNRRGLLAHFQAIAAATDLPIVIYNIPVRCGVDMPNDLLAELGQLDNIVAVKQARYEDVAPIDGVDLLAGNDDLLATVLDLGGGGGVLVASQIAGAQMRRMIDEPDRRAEIEQGLLPLYRALGVGPACVTTKAALRLLGHAVGGVRLPMVDVDDGELATIRSALQAQGMLGSESGPVAASAAPSWGS